MPLRSKYRHDVGSGRGRRRHDDLSERGNSRCRNRVHIDISDLLNNLEHLCQKSFRVEFCVELTRNMSIRAVVPVSTKPAVPNRLTRTACGSGILLKRTIPPHPLLLRTNTRLPASVTPTVGIGGVGEFLEQRRP